MDGSSRPPLDVTTAMESENDEGSKVRRNTDDTSAASASSTSPSTSPYPTIQADPEYRGQSSIRADCAFPVPTTSSSAPPGCGCATGTVIEPTIRISIRPTTGGQFDLTVERTDTIENVKKIISKRLKVAKERICLLHRERQLRRGTLWENRLQDGSRLTLLPNVETGLLAQRPEQSVMQALESLNDSQVNDFLSGKAPLNLTMRLGDHMMLIQLQLSTVTPASPGNNNQTNNSASALAISGNSSTSSNSSTNDVSPPLQSRRSSVLTTRSTTGTSTKVQSSTAAARTSSLNSFHIAASCGTSLSTMTTATNPVCSKSTAAASTVSSTTYSSISPPHSPFCNSQTQSSRGNSHRSASPTNSNLNTCQSCLLSHHHHHHNHHHYHHHFHHHHHSRNKSTTSPTSSTSSSSTILTSSSALTSVSTSPSSAASSSSLSSLSLSPTPSLSSSPSSSSSSSSSACSVISMDHLQQSTSASPSCTETVSWDVTPPRKKLCTAHHHTHQSTTGIDSSSTSLVEQSAKIAALDTRALAEASRNLTQKLKQLSSEDNTRRRQGAIIESMHHHGKGVYSGTFSGTLNPALQDRHGRPKRDISTIIYILNDLLCAAPAATAGHYRHHHRHSNVRQQSSTSMFSTSTATPSNGAAVVVGCHDSTTTAYSTEELSKENEATKGKMRRLRLVMEQRRAKRKARRQARAAAYTTQWAAVTPDPDPNHNPNTSTASSNTTSTTEPQTEPELQPCSPEPVVA